MVDFARLVETSLWKSAPLFSTGTKEAELMVRELRLNLQSPLARFVGSGFNGRATELDRGVGPKLSTAFAERLGQPSPGARVLVHGPNRASEQWSVMR
jgi:hypothetical protein